MTTRYLPEPEQAELKKNPDADLLKAIIECIIDERGGIREEADGAWRTD